MAAELEREDNGGGGTVPDLAGSAGNKQVVAPEFFEYHVIANAGVLPGVPWRALSGGVRGTLEAFIAHAEAGAYGDTWREVTGLNAHEHTTADGDVDMLHGMFTRSRSGVTAAAGTDNTEFTTYLLARAHVVMETFPATIRGALEGKLPAGVTAKVLAAPVKSFARSDSKWIAYATELKAAGPSGDAALYAQKLALEHTLSRSYVAGALIKDAARLTVATDTVAGARHIYHALAAALDVTSCKNRLDDPTRDVLLTVRVDGNFIAEIQIHQQRVLALKELTHAPYEVARLPANKCPLPNGLVSFSCWYADRLRADTMRLQPSYL